MCPIVRHLVNNPAIQQFFDMVNFRILNNSIPFHYPGPARFAAYREKNSNKSKEHTSFDGKCAFIEVIILALSESEYSQIFDEFVLILHGYYTT